MGIVHRFIGSKTIKSRYSGNLRAGNTPSNKVMQKLIADYIDKGGIVVNITQCLSGSVTQGKYATSSFFEKVGVCSGKDLTTESAVIEK